MWIDLDDRLSFKIIDEISSIEETMTSRSNKPREYYEKFPALSELKAAIESFHDTYKVKRPNE